MQQEIEVDVAVIGSGAAGFVAALTAKSLGLDVHIFEKAKVFGGTTALSGGVAWLPGNHLMDHDDDPESVLEYLRHHVGNRSNDAKLETFVDNASRSLEFLTDHGYLKVGRMMGFPDYRAETPGGDKAENNGGRSVEPLVFAGAKLGDWYPGLLHRPRPLPVVGTMSELRQLAAIRTDLGAFLKGWWAVPRSLWGKLTGAKHLSSGAALIGWLSFAAKREAIPLHLGSRLRSLEIAERQIRGLVIEDDEGPTRVHARCGVILASGGFDHNATLRETHLPRAGVQNFSSGARSNTGDSQVAAGEAGVSLAQMDDAWWAPTCLIPNVGPQIVIFERGKPGQIIVDARGRRFANEAQPYGDFVRAMFDADQASDCAIPAFMVFDQTFRDRYPIGNLMPGLTPQSAIDSGFLARADSLEALSVELGIDVDGLSNTVERHNAMAENGRDEDFHRGEFAFDRFSGDPTVTPNPCLAPIVKAPFYALKIYPGDLGAHGGIDTNEHAQALNEVGQPISGLYAVGNCAASMLGGFYPGAGGTLGPAITFAYVAANHLASAGAVKSSARTG